MSRRDARAAPTFHSLKARNRGGVHRHTRSVGALPRVVDLILPRFCGRRATTCQQTSRIRAVHEREGAGTCRVRSRRRTFRNASPCEVEQADGGRLEYRGDERSVHLARSTLQHGRQRHSTSHNAQRAQGDGSKTHITNDPAQQEEVKLAEDKQNRSQTVVPHRAQLVEHPEHDVGHENEVNNRGAVGTATQGERHVRGSERGQRHSRARPDAGQNE